MDFYIFVFSIRSLFCNNLITPGKGSMWRNRNQDVEKKNLYSFNLSSKIRFRNSLRIFSWLLLKWFLVEEKQHKQYILTWESQNFNYFCSPQNVFTCFTIDSSKTTAKNPCRWRHNTKSVNVVVVADVLVVVVCCCCCSDHFLKKRIIINDWRQNKI